MFRLLYCEYTLTLIIFHQLTPSTPSARHTDDTRRDVKGHMVQHEGAKIYRGWQENPLHKHFEASSPHVLDPRSPVAPTKPNPYRVPAFALAPPAMRSHSTPPMLPSSAHRGPTKLPPMMAPEPMMAWNCSAKKRPVVKKRTNPNPVVHSQS